MTEQSTVEATPEQTEQKPVTPSDPMLAMLQQTLVGQIEQANTLVATINANTTDKGKLVHDIRTDENTTDNKVREFQEWLAKAEEAIEKKRAEVDAHIVENLMPKGEDVDVEALKTQHKTLRDGIRAAQAFAKSLPNYKDEEFVLPDVSNLRGGSSSGSGDGGKRPRLNSIWIGTNEGDLTLISKPVEDKKKGVTRDVSNFTLAAGHIGKVVGEKIEVKDLQAAAFSAAKTDDLSTLSGRVFDYYFEAGKDDKRKNFLVRVEPKNTDDSSTDSE